MGGLHPDNAFVKVLLWPGLQLQRLTTREPDDGMVEVAVAALTAVAEHEARADAVAAAGDGPELTGSEGVRKRRCERDSNRYCAPTRN